jgi:hypothetical protein
MTSGSPSHAAARGSGGIPLVILLVLLALYLASQYGDALSIPFINDDYVFLDKTRDASFGSLWEPRALAFNWYRPWSRELHYWSLQRLFGARELPFHLVSFGLALGVLGAYFAWTRRLAGDAAAAVATSGVGAMAAWGVPMLWIAGVQDLWMLVFALAFLHAVAADSRVGASLALVLALLSKEAAAVLPGIAVAYQLTVERRNLREAARWVLPLVVIVGVWAALHPVLGGRWWRPLAEPPPPGLHPPLAEVGIRTLAAPLNLDAWPAPEYGWGRALMKSAPGALLLAAVVGWAARGRSVVRAGSRRVALFGAFAAGVGWLPLLMPTLGWHAYYALLGALGAWLALGIVLARWPVAAVGVVAALALVRGARAETPSHDWGSEWYQRRAAEFLAVMRADLKHELPDPPPHSRLYFVLVPSSVGFLAGDGPALRVWYGDPTLRGGYYPSYRPRGPQDSAGVDRFFRFDSLAGWVPVHRGPEDVVAARRANPRWLLDHQTLAKALAEAGDWPAAAVEYEKLSAAEPLHVDFAYNAGVCYETLGDSSRAATWYARAAALPGADEEMREAARRLARPGATATRNAPP